MDFESEGGTGKDEKDSGKLSFSYQISYYAAGGLGLMIPMDYARSRACFTHIFNILP